MSHEPDFQVFVESVRTVPDPGGGGINDTYSWATTTLQVVEAQARQKLEAVLTQTVAPAEGLTVPMGILGPGEKGIDYELWSLETGGVVASATSITFLPGARVAQVWVEALAGLTVNKVLTATLLPEQGPVFDPQLDQPYVPTEPTEATINLIDAGQASTVSFWTDASDVDETGTVTRLRILISPPAVGDEKTTVTRDAGTSTANTPANYTTVDALPLIINWFAGQDEFELLVTPVANEITDPVPLHLDLDLGTYVNTSAGTYDRHELTFNDTSQTPPSSQTVAWSEELVVVFEPVGAGTHQDYTAYLVPNADPVVAMTVDISMDLVTATAADVVLLTSQVTMEPIPPGGSWPHENGWPVRYRVLGDGLFEAERTFTLTLDVSAGGSNREPSVQTVIIRSTDPAPTVSFVEAASTVQNVGNYLVPMVLSGQSLETTFVAFRQGTGGTFPPAVEGVHFEWVASSPIQFPALVTQRGTVFRVLPWVDPGAQFDLAITIDVAGSTNLGGTTEPSTHIATLVEPAAQAPELNWEFSQSQGDENTINNTFKGLFTLNGVSHATTAPITINLTADSVGLPNPATFGAGNDIEWLINFPIVIPQAGATQILILWTAGDVSANVQGRLTMDSIVVAGPEGSGATLGTLTEHIVEVVDTSGGVDGNLHGLAPERQSYDPDNPDIEVTPGFYEVFTGPSQTAGTVAAANPVAQVNQQRAGGLVSIVQELWQGKNQGVSAGHAALTEGLGRGWELNPVTVRVDGVIAGELKVNGSNQPNASFSGDGFQVYRDIIYYGATGPSTDRLDRVSLNESGGSMVPGASKSGRHDNLRFENLTIRGTNAGGVGGGDAKNQGLSKWYDCELEGTAVPSAGPFTGQKWGMHFPGGHMIDVRSCNFEPAQEHHLYFNNLYGGKYPGGTAAALLPNGHVDKHNALTMINVGSKVWRVNPGNWLTAPLGSGRTHLQVRTDWPHLTNYPPGEQSQGRILILRCMKFADAGRQFGDGGAALTIMGHGSGNPSNSEVYIKDSACDGPWGDFDLTDNNIAAPAPGQPPSSIKRRAMGITGPTPVSFDPTASGVPCGPGFQPCSARSWFRAPIGPNAGEFVIPKVIIDGYLIAGEVTPGTDSHPHPGLVNIIGVEELEFQKFKFRITTGAGSIGIGSMMHWRLNDWALADAWYVTGVDFLPFGGLPQHGYQGLVAPDHWGYHQIGKVTWNLRDPDTDVPYPIGAGESNRLVDYPGWNQDNPQGPPRRIGHGRAGDAGAVQTPGNVTAGPCDLTRIWPDDPHNGFVLLTDAQLETGAPGGEPYDGTDPSPWTNPC